MGDDVRMDLIERFTRDRASRFVWGLVAIACTLALVFARQGESRASARALDAAASRSLVYANQVVAPLVDEKADGVHLYYKTVYPSVQAGIFTDPEVAVVRVWAPDGSLLFASDSVRRLAGQIQATGAPGIQAAMEGRSYSQIVVEPFTVSTTGTATSDTTLFQTFTPLLVSDRIAPVGAVEIDYLYDSLRSEGAGAWARLQLLLGALVLVSVVMFLLSMRVPKEQGAVTPLRGRLDRMRGGSTLEPDQPAAAATEAESPEAAPPSSAAAPASQTVVSAASGSEREGASDQARIAELEEALAEAEWEMSGLKAKDDAHAATLAALESQRRAHESRAEELSGRVAALEAQLVELATTQGSNEAVPLQDDGGPAAGDEDRTASEPTAAAAEPEPETGIETDEPETAEPEPETENETEPTSNGDVDDPLGLLEARLAEAEQRATEAEGRVSQASPDAAELRARLARTAARKKGITAIGDDQPAG